MAKAEIRIEKNYNEIMTSIAKTKASILTPYAILALMIVNENYSARYPTIYIGEVEAVFMSMLPKDQRADWTYASIGAVLNKLHKQGYLTKEKDGRWVTYGVSDKGVKELVALYGPEMNRKKRVWRKNKVTENA